MMRMNTEGLILELKTLQKYLQISRSHMLEMLTTTEAMVKPTP